MYKLTPTDREILHAMETMVDAIATMFGEHTEVLLHALDEDDPCVTKIANGHITGREVGAPITNIALLKLEEGYDVSSPYITKSSDGKTLRSYTTIIRNSSQQAIGLICVNSNLDAPFQSVMQALLPGIPHYHEGNITPEVFAKSNSDAMLDTIHTVRDNVLANTNIAPSKKNREIVTELFDLGVFDIKDSAQIAATELDTSVHTIYRYLRQLRDEEVVV
ncbi:helix-turn-helix transcriptional regulator [Vibrio algicola]|uniref:YheO-like PAS domain protein n=1 Tax=Vibrio algicola TaxID=2662262 RepID=A0A5Q0TI17_9VIBR|nr:PAS domain-containing protein [Vibrio algicola]